MYIHKSQYMTPHHIYIVFRLIVVETHKTLPFFHNTMCLSFTFIYCMYHDYLYIVLRLIVVEMHKSYNFSYTKSIHISYIDNFYIYAFGFIL
jgi:hypothetical protein